MKKLNTFLVCAALASTAVSHAETLSVYGDGSATSTYLPLNIYYCSNNIHTQMIYPASELEAMKGKVIEKITFTVTRIGGGVWNSPQVNIKMGTTQQSEYTATDYITEGLVDVASVSDISWPTTLTAPMTWEIALDTQFTYTGDNLIFDFTNVKGTGPRNWTFKGAAQSVSTGLSMTSTARMEKFLPSVEFEYSEAAGTSATISTSSVFFPMQFIGEDATSTVRVTNTGTSTLNGTVSCTDNVFTVTPTTIVDLTPGQSIDLLISYDAESAGNHTAVLNVDFGSQATLTAKLSGMAVTGPTAVRTLFNGQLYDSKLPEDWSAYAVETYTDGGEFSDATTNYSAFGSNYLFESASVDNHSCLLWNHANPVFYSDIYTRAYYIVSPVCHGDFSLAGSLYDDAATGAYIKAYKAKYDATNGLFTLGEELPLTWNESLAKDTWSTATGTTDESCHIAFQLKYSALGYFAADLKADGISTISADINTPVEYFTLQGVRVNSPSTPGLYIRRSGTSTSKVLIR